MEMVDTETCEEPHSREDAPRGDSLRRFFRKAACDANESIKYLAGKEALNKSSRQNRALEGPAVGFPPTGGTKYVDLVYVIKDQ